MSEKNKESLSAFMKKQNSEKSSKNLQKKSAIDANKLKQDGEKKDDVSKEDEMSEEEKLEEAKKASKNKAGQRDQTEMLKKLFLENVAKYVMIILLLVLTSIGVIKYGPEFFKIFHGLIFKLFLRSL
jgi:Flp pilus assembly protein TadB